MAKFLPDLRDNLLFALFLAEGFCEVILKKAILTAQNHINHINIVENYPSPRGGQRTKKSSGSYRRPGRLPYGGKEEKATDL
jgi:hypothetical protein